MNPAVAGFIIWIGGFMILLGVDAYRNGPLGTQGNGLGVDFKAFAMLFWPVVLAIGPIVFLMLGVPQIVAEWLRNRN